MRRVHVAGVLTFLFENAATIRYQVQEMVRAERMTRDEDIRHELETYNELLGGKGELGATLLIELPDPAERDHKLREWLALPSHLYLELEGGEKVRSTFDPRQVGTDRLSSVQYLKFDVRGRTPIAVGLRSAGARRALRPHARAARRARGRFSGATRADRRPRTCPAELTPTSDRGRARPGGRTRPEHPS